MPFSFLKIFRNRNKTSPVSLKRIQVKPCPDAEKIAKQMSEKEIHRALELRGARVLRRQSIKPGKALHSINARQVAGFPEGLIEEMCLIAWEMNLAISIRVGNRARTDLKVPLCTKTMDVKTKTCNISPMKGTIPEYQSLFGREGGAVIPKTLATFQDFPITLRSLLAEIEDGHLNYDGMEKRTDGGYLVFKPSQEELPKGLGRYMKVDGKEKLYFSPEGQSALRYYYKLQEDEIPSVPITDEMRRKLSPWAQQVEYKQPNWWRSEFGRFVDHLDRQQSFYFDDKTNDISLQKARVLANKEGHVMVGDCDLLALMPSQEFLNESNHYEIKDLENGKWINNLKKILITPLDLGKFDDRKKMIYFLHYTRQAFLLYNIGQTKNEIAKLRARDVKSGTIAHKNLKKYQQEYKKLKKMTRRDLLAPMLDAETGDEQFGRMTGILTSIELLFSLKVNEEFAAIGSHMGQSIWHGSDNRNPTGPSSLDDKALHILNGQVYLTHDEEGYKQFVELCLSAEDNAYYLDIPPTWPMGNWAKIIDREAACGMEDQIQVLTLPAKERFESLNALAVIECPQISTVARKNSIFSPSLFFQRDSVSSKNRESLGSTRQSLFSRRTIHSPQLTFQQSVCDLHQTI
jgi:hypothetical protein